MQFPTLARELVPRPCRHRLTRRSSELVLRFDLAAMANRDDGPLDPGDGDQVVERLPYRKVVRGDASSGLDELVRREQQRKGQDSGEEGH